MFVLVMQAEMDFFLTLSWVYIWFASDSRHVLSHQLNYFFKDPRLEKKYRDLQQL